MTKEIIKEKVNAGDAVVVYSVATGRIRRIAVANKDERIKDIDIVAGEAVQVFAKTKDETPLTLQDKLNAVTGKTPSSDRYVLVDGSGKIVGAICADPTCGDSIPGCEMIQHDTADGSWTFNTTTRQFVEPPKPPPIPGRA